MVTRHKHYVSKTSCAIALLVISAFVSSVRADGQQTDFQRARTLMARQRTGQTLTDEEQAFLAKMLEARSQRSGESRGPRPGGGDRQQEKGRQARFRIPPRDELFASVKNLNHRFDVVYGVDDPKYQVLDAWLVVSNRPAPVLLQFHAGGYVGGNKSEFIGRSADRFEAFLKAGISLVSCHYRLAPDYTFPAPLYDTARAIQFVRSKAKQWNIDPDRIAVTGGSAGGQLATWVGLAPDFADPNSDDLVARESSRVTCFIGCGPLYFANLKPVPVQVLRAFNCSQREWDNPDSALRNRIAYATPETHLSPDDPPGMLHYMRPPFGLKEGQDFASVPVPDHWQGPHDTWHGIKLARKMRETGVDVEAVLGHTASTQRQLSFLKKHFNMP